MRLKKTSQSIKIPQRTPFGKAEEIVLAIFLNNVRKDIAANGITGCNVEKWKAECQAYYKAIGKNIPESILKIHSGIDVIQLVH